MENSRPILIRPDKQYIEPYLQALYEYHQEGRYLYHDPYDIMRTPDRFIESLHEDAGHPYQPHQDWVEMVPETILWLVDDKHYLGTVEIRHRLNWHLEKWGGHLHFLIRPSMRGKGYGNALLPQAFAFAQYLKLEEILMTVSLKNTLAQKLIEKHHAVLKDITKGDERFPPRKLYIARTAGL